MMFVELMSMYTAQRPSWIIGRQAVRAGVRANLVGIYFRGDPTTRGAACTADNVQASRSSPATVASLISIKPMVCVTHGDCRAALACGGVARRFPNLRARDLEGTALDLPLALAGDPSVVIVAFERRQQATVDTWLPWLSGLRQRVPGTEVYEVPTLSRRWLPARRLIDGGMRAGIPDPSTRRRTLTTYTDIHAVLDALALDVTDTIAVVVVGSDGIILWQALGEYDTVLAAELERAVTTAHRPERNAVEASPLLATSERGIPG